MSLPGIANLLGNNQVDVTSLIAKPLPNRGVDPYRGSISPALCHVERRFELTAPLPEALI
jgi:hypothetical protein